MTYELTILDALQVLPHGLFFVLILFIGVGALLYRYSPSTPRWITVLLGGIIPLCILFFCLYLTYEIAGSGWRLDGNTLELKALHNRKTVPLSTARIAMVNASGPWWPVWRTNGYAGREFSAGYFQLKNGSSALLFYHRSSEKLIVVQTREEIIVIGHPGVEKLYHSLITPPANMRTGDSASF